MYHVTICAVIWGVDESILNINLGDGFEFKKMSLIPLKDNLDEIFERDAMGLRRDYEAARIDNDLNVICIYKSELIDLDIQRVESYYSKVLRCLDHKIRIIRLYNEGAIRFKWLSIRIESKEILAENTKMKYERNSIIPIGEAMNTRRLSKVQVDDTNLIQINNSLKTIKLPFEDLIINNAHRYYDLSYHVDKNVAITLLITCLELLFLLKDESAKKERVSKRCAMFLYEDKSERLTCYKQLKSLYKKRSEFVHEGKDLNIADEDIISLRSYVRKSIIRYIEKNENKKEVVDELKREINKLDYWDN